MLRVILARRNWYLNYNTLGTQNNHYKSMLTVDQLTHKTTVILLLTLMSFCIAMIITPVYTHLAYKYKWWKKRERTESVSGGAASVVSKLRIKRTIPMMGGLIAVIAAAVTTFAFNLDRNQTWLPLAALLGGGFVGLIDDAINIRGGGGKKGGLRATVKFAMITLVAALAAWFFYYKLGFTSIHIPFAGDVNLGWFIIPVFMLVVVSTSNAVNISDGIDGLAGGLLISAFGAFGVIAALQGNIGIAGFCMTIVGALLSYVWFNIPPARFVMGDVGSFSLGTALGVVAMLTNTVLLLILIGLVFVVEAGSTLLQVTSKKLLHRRIFIAAPLHHHLEAIGWPKTKVTMRLWVIGQTCAALGIVLALVGGYI